MDPRVLAALGYPAVFLVNAISGVTLFVPVPGQAVIFAGGSLLHPAIVALAAAAGMTLGLLVCYQVGATGSPLLQKATAHHNNLASTALRKGEVWFQRCGVWAVFLLVAVPTPFFDFAALWAGAIRMPVWSFILGAFLGKLVSAFAVAMAGSYLMLAAGVGS
ncbi:MAG: VTT domain-containing protein [Chloroflexi bacterium]|nr:VTT domain-containing protein [Chloroflexota bacterium]